MVQVFLTIARKAEVEAAAQEGRSHQTIHLGEAGVLKVGLGEEYGTVEGTSQQYQIKWAQDESGNLQVAIQSDWSFTSPCSFRRKDCCMTARLKSPKHRLNPQSIGSVPQSSTAACRVLHNQSSLCATAMCMIL